MTNKELSKQLYNIGQSLISLALKVESESEQFPTVKPVLTKTKVSSDKEPSIKKYVWKSKRKGEAHTKYVGRYKVGEKPIKYVGTFKTPQEASRAVDTEIKKILN